MPCFDRKCFVRLGTDKLIFRVQDEQADMIQRAARLHLQKLDMHGMGDSVLLIATCEEIGSGTHFLRPRRLHGF